MYQIGGLSSLRLPATSGTPDLFHRGVAFSYRSTIVTYILVDGAQSFYWLFSQEARNRFDLFGLL